MVGHESDRGWERSVLEVGAGPNVLLRTFYAAFAHATEWYVRAKMERLGEFRIGAPNANRAGVAGFVGIISCRIGVMPTPQFYVG